MATKLWSEVRKKHSKLTETERAKIDRDVKGEVFEMRLRELAEALEKLQGEISQFEKRPDHLLSTLREYVRALGGKLEVIAQFGDKSVRLVDV